MSGDRWGDGGPPDEAYSRVGDEARYLGLHAGADALVADLRARHDVTVEPVEASGPWAVVERATRLTPDGGGAPLTVIWTGFGVALRAGHAWERGYPVCGCDACDEDADDLADQIRTDAEAVAGGGLTESRRRRMVGADPWRIELRHPGRRSASSGMDGPEGRAAAVPVGTTRWPAWPRH